MYNLCLGVLSCDRAAFGCGMRCHWLVVHEILEACRVSVIMFVSKAGAAGWSSI